MDPTSPPETTSGELSERYPGFNSFKTLAPIHYPKRWFRDALIQTTFDTSVMSLSPAPVSFINLRAPVEFAFQIQRLDGSPRLVLLTTGTVPRAWHASVQAIVLDRRQLLSGPMAMVCRSIWSQQRMPIDPGDQYRCIELILERGGSVTMGEAVRVCRRSDLDAVQQVCSMLAQGVLISNLSQGLQPGTILSIGPKGVRIREPDEGRIQKK